MARPIPYPVLTILQRCHELETTMGQVYTELARAHAAHPRVAALWMKTAKEEANHGSQFSLAQSLGGEVMTSPKVDTGDVDKALKDARTFLQDIKRAAPRVEEALRRAIELEEEMVKFHLHMAVAFESKGHEQLFRAMMAADKGHVTALRAELDHILGERR